jgi:hypothetical protein
MSSLNSVALNDFSESISEDVARVGEVSMGMVHLFGGLAGGVVGDELRRADEVVVRVSRGRSLQCVLIFG